MTSQSFANKISFIYLQLRLHDKHKNQIHPRGRLAKFRISGERDKNDFPQYSSGIRQLHLQSIRRAERTDFLKVCASNL